MPPAAPKIGRARQKIPVDGWPVGVAKVCGNKIYRERERDAGVFFDGGRGGGHGFVDRGGGAEGGIPRDYFLLCDAFFWFSICLNDWKEETGGDAATPQLLRREES